MDKSSLIYPMFIVEGTNIKEEIPSMMGPVPLQCGSYGGKTGAVELKQGIGGVIAFWNPGSQG